MSHFKDGYFASLCLGHSPIERQNLKSFYFIGISMRQIFDNPKSNS